MRIRRWIATALAVIALVVTTLVVAIVTVTACQSGGTPSAPAHAAAPTSVPSATSLDLLERLVPVLHYAEGEKFRANPPEALVEHRDSTLRRGGPNGEVIAAGTGEPVRLALGFLGPRRYGNGEPTSREDTISMSPDYRGWADRRDDLRRYDDVVYGRVVHGSDGRTWLQYWFFYVFNDSLPCWGDTPQGSLYDHEGDWEVVQIRLDAAGHAPDLVVVSQHKGAEARAWVDVEKLDGHPVIYPALGTHAGAFSAGCHFIRIDFPDRGGAPDCNNGRGPQVTPALRSLDVQWAAWQGRFGTIAAPCTTATWRDPVALVP